MRNQFFVALLATFCAFESTAAQPKVSTAVDTGGITVRRSVDYLANGREERADLYLPKEESGGKPHPAVLIIHGGGWTGGKRDAAREINIGTTLAQHGYVAMSIDYWTFAQ